MGSQSVPPPTAPAVPASPPAPPPPPMQRTAPQTDPSQTLAGRLINPLGQRPTGITLGATAVREQLRATNARGFSAPGTRRRTELVPVPPDDPRLIEIQKQVQRSFVSNRNRNPLSQDAYPVALDLATNELVFKGDPRLDVEIDGTPYISTEVKRTPRLREKLGQIPSPIHIDGYFPLYTDRNDAIKASPTPNVARSGERTKGYHAHFLRGKTYFMPNGLQMGVTMFHGDYDPPINDAGPYTVEGTATNEAPYKGERGFYYPLWTSGALADQANANTQGGVHEHTFAEFPNVVFYMPNDQANHAEATPGPYRLYRSGDGLQTDKAPVVPNVSRVISSPVRFQIVNLDSSLSRKTEFVAGGTNAASPQFFVEEIDILVGNTASGGSTPTQTIFPSRISPQRSSLFEITGRSSLNNAAKVSKAELTGTGKVVNESAELNNATRTQINGVVTPVVGQGGIIQDQQLFTFMSGSNIRIDTDGERSEVIRISVDDLFLSELQDVDINLDADLANNRILVFDTSLGSGVTGITGGFKSKDFTTAFTSLTPRFSGMVSSGGVTGTQFISTSSGYVFPDGTVQTTAADFTDPESGIEYQIEGSGTGPGIATWSDPYIFIDGIVPGASSVTFTGGYTSGFSGDGITLGFGARDYLLQAKVGDNIHVVGEDSNARVIGRMFLDATDSPSNEQVSLSFIPLVGNGIPYSVSERVSVLIVPGNHKVVSFNGLSGDVTGVGSFNGLTGAVTGVASVNGSTGDIVGIATTGANVFTGTVTAQTGITLGNGITFPDGSYQSTAAERGYQYTVSSTTSTDNPSGGECVIDDVLGFVHTLKLSGTDADGNDLDDLMEYFAEVGGNVKYSSLDGKTVGQLHSDYLDYNNRSWDGTGKILSIGALSGDDLAFILEEPSVGDTVYFTIEPHDLNMVTSLGGFTGAIRASDGLQVVEVAAIPFFQQDPAYTKNTATFTISSKSAIGTGAKTNSLHRLPYDATLTGIEVIGNKTGGFSAGVMVAGGVLGHPTVGAITGSTLGLAGATGTSTTIESGLTSASMTGGNFLYVQVFDNTAGCTNAQLFATYKRR